MTELWQAAPRKRQSGKQADAHALLDDQSFDAIVYHGNSALALRAAVCVCSVAVHAVHFSEDWKAGRRAYISRPVLPNRAWKQRASDRIFHAPPHSDVHALKLPGRNTHGHLLCVTVHGHLHGDHQVYRVQLTKIHVTGCGVWHHDR
jgi:hypothetical protein